MFNFCGCDILKKKGGINCGIKYVCRWEITGIHQQKYYDLLFYHKKEENYGRSKSEILNDDLNDLEEMFIQDIEKEKER